MSESDLASLGNITPAKQAYLEQCRAEDAQRKSSSPDPIDAWKAAKVGDLITNGEPPQLREQLGQQERKPRQDYVQACANINRWRLWDAAEIPRDYREADLDRLNPALPDAYKFAVATLKTLLDTPGTFLIAGDRETGKTWLGCGLCRVFCRAEKSSLYTLPRVMFDRIAESPFDRKETTREIFVRPKLLIINHAHMRHEGREDDALATLIQVRSTNGLSTVLIIPMTKGDALRNLGPLIQTRVKSRVIEASWQNIPAVLRAAQMDR
jgi:hypothetical protein